MEPIPLTSVVTASSAGPPNNETAMYCRFSIIAKPSPMLKPTRKPDLLLLMEPMKKSSTVALNVSSIIGAPIATIVKNASSSDQYFGINSGTANEFRIKAGKALIIPAANHASASTRLAGILNLLHAKDHHARTGIENPKIHKGIANTPKARIGIKEPPEVDIHKDKSVPITTQIANMAHGHLETGNSRGVPSLSR